MQSITATHRQIISDFNSIKQAINTQGVTVTDEPTSEYAQKILDIQANPTLITKNITVNGTYDASDDSADGYSEVVVNVPAPVPNLQDKTVTQNGTVTADQGYDGLDEVTVNVQPNVGSKNITTNGTYNASSDSLDGYSNVNVNVQPNLQNKTVTQNGTVTADSGYDGLGEVTVDVQGSSPLLAQIDVVDNGVYRASTLGVDGFNEIDADVRGMLLIELYNKSTIDLISCDIHGARLAFEYNGAAPSSDQTISLYVNIGNDSGLDFSQLWNSDYPTVIQSANIVFNNPRYATNGFFQGVHNFDTYNIYNNNVPITIKVDSYSAQYLFKNATFKNNSIDMAWLKLAMYAHINEMFKGCSTVEEIKNIDLMGTDSFIDIFSGCTNLRTLTAKSGTYVGTSWSAATLDLSASSYLDIMGYVNSLTASPSSSYVILRVHPTVYAGLSQADLQTALAKSYSIVSA